LFPPTQPAHPLPVLMSDELWINVSALAARGLVSGGVWDRRAILVHAPLVLMNGAQTGVDSGSLCAAQWPSDSNYRRTGSQGPSIKEEAVRGGLREQR